MTLKHILALVTFFTVGAAVTYATPVCVAGGSLDQYTTAGYSCEAGDVVYTVISYTATGADPTAAQTSVGIDNFPNTVAKTWQVGLQLGSSVTGLVWTGAPFSVDYTVTIDQAACAAEFGAGSVCSINEAQGQFQDGSAGSSNSATMTDVISGGGTLDLNDLTTGANTGQIFFSPITTSNISITGGGLSSTYAIEGFGLDVYETVSTGVPEPASLGLLGAGLVGLGLVSRKRSARQ